MLTYVFIGNLRKKICCLWVWQVFTQQNHISRLHNSLFIAYIWCWECERIFPAPISFASLRLHWMCILCCAFGMGTTGHKLIATNDAVNCEKIYGFFICLFSFAFLSAYMHLYAFEMRWHFCSLCIVSMVKMKYRTLSKSVHMFYIGIGPFCHWNAIHFQFHSEQLELL